MQIFKMENNERGKMAIDTEEPIECALDSENIVNITNQSKHVKRKLKKTITKSVSTLRNIFHTLKKDIIN